MKDVKWIGKSKTIWGLLITLLGVVVDAALAEELDALGSRFFELLPQLLEFAGLVMAFIGRWFSKGEKLTIGTSMPGILLLLIVPLLFVLSGCHASRTLTVERTPSPSINTRTDTSFTQAPRLMPMPRAGINRSFPLEVRRYRDTLGGPALDLREVVIDGSTITLRLRTMETVHRLPVRGEVKTLRPNGGGIEEFIEGDPEPT